ncbi:dNA recombination protein RmuC [Prevotella sp. CAG:1320]|mgnify:FL=1|nr:dNA recombination protein RmuC [Prevotella sp. CAG:1320]
MVYLAFILGLLIGAALVFILMGRENTRLRVDNARLQTQLEQAGKRMEERRQEMERQVEATKQELALRTQELLRQNADRLKQENAEHMTLLTTPLREAISEMRRALEDTTKHSAEDNASLRELLAQMMRSNREIGEQAELLANVLRRDSQAAGYMGEVILGDLLAAQGLVEGVHYESQPYLRDAKGRKARNEDTGSAMRPDFILHYPQGQDVVIDSKVSMAAYERYVNATDPEEKAKALKAHIQSVRKHVDELAGKDYSRYLDPGRQAVDFVLMFMPFESSLQLALANDPSLWHEAFERKVFITSEQNLTAILHMIHVAWVQNQQAQNQRLVFGLAEQLIDRLGDFIKRYTALGERLEQAKRAFDDCGKKLYAGNQSVVKKAHELIDMGAKENPDRRIPPAQDELPA